MSKVQTIELSYEVGTALMRGAYLWNMPEKTGEKKTFSPTIRAKINKKLRRTFRALKKESPIWMEDELLYFGPREGWEARARTEEEREKLVPGAGEQVDKVNYMAKNPRKEISVELGKAAADGIYWLLYLMCHPGSKACLGAGKQELVVWAVAEKLKYTKQLEEAIGLKEDESIEIKTDDEYEDDDDKEETVEPDQVPEPAGA